MKYSFKQARSRIQELTFMYRRAKHAGVDEMTLWRIAAEIEELEKEINDAHKTERVS